LPAGVRRAADQAFCGLFQLIFPDDCRVCGEPLHEVSRIPVCHACLSRPESLAADYFCLDCHIPFLNRFPLDEHGRCALCRLGLTGFDTAYTFGSYEDTLRELIHLFKYEKVQPLKKPLGALIAQAVPRDRQFDVIVPMPLHWKRRWIRGFNQSQLLAGEISRRLGVPVIRAVRRVKETSPQAGLTNAKRRLNMRGAFAIRQGTNLKNLRVLLIDDVLTTGATASACAKVLKRAGASHVAVAAIARTDRRTFLTEHEQPLAAAAGSGTT
jgi:ComF family protein